MMQVSEFRMPGSSSGSDGRKSESSQEDANQHNDSTSQTVKYSSIFSQSLFTQKNEQANSEEKEMGTGFVGSNLAFTASPSASLPALSSNCSPVFRAQTLPQQLSFSQHNLDAHFVSSHMVMPSTFQRADMGGAQSEGARDEGNLSGLEGQKQTDACSESLVD